MQTVSESAMKVVWTAGDARQIPGLRSSVLRFGYLYISCLGSFRTAGYVGIGISRRIGTVTGR